MKQEDNIVKEFEAAVLSIRTKYQESNGDLYDLEESIFTEIQEVQKNLMNKLHLEMNRVSKKKRCPCCNKKLKFKEFRLKNILTRFGKITESKPYYDCKTCKKSGYFIDSLQRITYGKFSPKLTELLCLMGKDDPFTMCPDKVKRIFNIKVSETSIRNLTAHVGKLLFNHEEALAELQEKKIQCMPTSFETFPKKTFVEIDGLMLNTTDKNAEKGSWKEYKLAMSFSDSDMETSGVGLNQRTTINKKNLTGSMALGPKDIKKRLKYWMKQNKSYWSNVVILVSDGANWIENIFQEVFPGAPMVLDWFHAVEKLWECSKKIHGENRNQNENWVKFYETLLWNGEIKIVLDLLLKKCDKAKNQTPLRELYSYFCNRKDRMKYAEFREKGYCIGSGAIESANKYVIQSRLKRAGMKWDVMVANGVAYLRNAMFSDRWDMIWQKNYLKATP